MNERTIVNNKHRLPEPLTPEQIEAAREARKSYYRERYKKDPQKQRERNLRYWAKRAAERKEAGTDG